MELPRVLPQVPKGWTKQMSMHLNFGHGKKGGGVGTYRIFDEKKQEMPIGWQYDTRHGGETGFVLPMVEHAMTWEQLRDMWPIWLGRQMEDEFAFLDD